MNLRVARKIRKRWKAAFVVEEKVASYRWQKENGSFFQGLFDKMGSGPVPAPRLLLTHAEARTYLRGTPAYSRRQVTRAFRVLQGEERTEWAVDFALLRARRKHAKMTPWEQAQAISNIWPDIIGMFIDDGFPAEAPAEAPAGAEATTG